VTWREVAQLLPRKPLIDEAVWMLEMIAGRPHTAGCNH
jgi:hypothetical protein